MNVIIDYANYVFGWIVDILDTIKLPGSISLLHYILGAIIIGFIFKLMKGSANEFESSMNFTTGTLIQNKTSKYNQNRKRKEQLVENLKKENIVYEYMDENY